MTRAPALYAGRSLGRRWRRAFAGEIEVEGLEVSATRYGLVDFGITDQPSLRGRRSITCAGTCRLHRRLAPGARDPDPIALEGSAARPYTPVRHRRRVQPQPGPG